MSGEVVTGEATIGPAELARMRARLQCRNRQRQAALAERLARARADFERIVDHLWRSYRLTRIWQWGSLIHERHFWERSDIDIAVEGVDAAATYFAIIADAEARTGLPVHVVELDKLHPAFAEWIRVSGRVVRGG